MQRLKALKTHTDFTEAMLFIERSIKLDAGISYMFSEVIWDARDIDGIKKHFKERIKQWAIGIRKYGSQADKDCHACEADDPIKAAAFEEDVDDDANDQSEKRHDEYRSYLGKIAFGKISVDGHCSEHAGCDEECLRQRRDVEHIEQH